MDQFALIGSSCLTLMILMPLLYALLKLAKKPKKDRFRVICAENTLIACGYECRKCRHLYDEDLSRCPKCK